MTNKSSKQHNDQEWEKWQGTGHFNKGMYLQRALFLQDWIKDIAPKTIVEIASGGYVMAVETLKNFPGIKYTWTEFSDIAIEEARQAGLSSASFLDVREIEGGEFKGVDLVICFGTDHIEDDLGLFRKIPNRKIVCVRGRKTKNHFRGFDNEDQVRERYKEFDIKRIATLNIPGHKSGEFWVEQDQMFLIDMLS